MDAVRLLGHLEPGGFSGVGVVSHMSSTRTRGSKCGRPMIPPGISFFGAGEGLVGGIRTSPARENNGRIFGGEFL